MPSSGSAAQSLEIVDRQLRAALAAIATAKDAVAEGVTALPSTTSYSTRSVLEASARNLDFESRRVEEVRRSLTRQPDDQTARRPW